MKKRICQFSTGFHPGDAITQEMLAFDSIFRKMGWESEIFSEHIGSAVKNKAKRFINYKQEKNDIIIYHHSIHSVIGDFVSQQKCPIILIYHNVTPSYFYESYDLPFAYSLKKGKEELLDFRNIFLKSFADSEYNKKELEELGYNNVDILPIAYDFNSLEIEGVIRNSFEGLKILFVGRITPNKKQEDLIRFAEIFRKYFRTDFQLQIVGYSSPASKSYMDELSNLVRFWNLEENVHFSGYVTHPELVGYYRNSDIFLSMSEHEGFCVPLIEAMFFKLPILAFSAGAVPDTLDGSGILFKHKNFPLIGEMIEEIMSNISIKEKIIHKQNQRLEEFKLEKPEEAIVRFIEKI
jgi:glycosyltransferase involved in cell wall biosynthesis